MSHALEKIYLAVTGVLASVAVCGNAANCEPAQKPKKAQSCCSSVSCAQSPYTWPGCLSPPYCVEFNLRGEALYWVAELGGLESAFGDTTIETSVAGGITTTTVVETDVDPSWKWRPGFRVGLDCAFTCNVIEADWTHYDGKASVHEGAQKGHWKLHYDTIDLIYGRRCPVASCFYFKPFIGARGLLVRQKLNSTLDTLFTALIGDNTVTTVLDDKEKTWGVGPELGVEGNWYMGGNFSLYGLFDVVAYYGHVKTDIYNTDTFTSTVSISDGVIRRNFNVIGTDIAFGVRYDQAWSVASEVLMTVKLGVEQHRIYDFSNLGSDGTLSLDGANLALSVGYRY